MKISSRQVFSSSTLLVFGIVICLLATTASATRTTNNNNNNNTSSIIYSFSNGVNNTKTILHRCNCIVFRMDDVQDYFAHQGQLAVMNLFLSKNQSLSLGLVMNQFGYDPTIVHKVMEGVNKGLFELAIHGWDHVDYTNLTIKEQMDSLYKANTKMQNLFGRSSNIFIPPYDEFNNSTIYAMHKLGLKIISASNDTDGNLYTRINEIYHLPQTVEFNTFDKNRNILEIPLQQILHNVGNSISKYGYAVVTIHPQFFIKKIGRLYTDAIDEHRINNLKDLLNFALVKYKHITTFSAISGINQGIIFTQYGNKSNNNTNNNSSNAAAPLSFSNNNTKYHTMIDKFGIREIYPSTNGGKEWYMNLENPTNDSLFSITPRKILHNATKQSDHSWLLSTNIIRMNVNTRFGMTPWKNVEMTGYVKVLSIIHSNNINEEDNITDDIDWYARGGVHRSSEPCEGTALRGILYVNGTSVWIKEIWHNGGFTEPRDIVKVTDSINERWIGWKVVMYNINNNKWIKMESYIDSKNDNKWVKVADLIDKGDWYAIKPDKIFFSANCNRSKNYIITNGGDIATFSSDNLALEFKNLSIREIQSPKS